jgi:hypothetical protein
VPPATDVTVGVGESYRSDGSWRLAATTTVDDAAAAGTSRWESEGCIVLIHTASNISLKAAFKQRERAVSLVAACYGVLPRCYHTAIHSVGLVSVVDESLTVDGTQGAPGLLACCCVHDRASVLSIWWGCR